jgi:hypothetical protein
MEYSTSTKPKQLGIDARRGHPRRGKNTGDVLVPDIVYTNENMGFRMPMSGHSTKSIFPHALGALQIAI